MRRLKFDYKLKRKWGVRTCKKRVFAWKLNIEINYKIKYNNLKRQDRNKTRMEP